ncbi:unnamed protein product [Caretta caretta]
MILPGDTSPARTNLRPRKRGGPQSLLCRDTMAPSNHLGHGGMRDVKRAFREIITCLTHAPVLVFADPSEPFILHTDASLEGLGAVLYQEVEGKCKPVAFASRGLSDSETRYPTHKLEFLALKWAITEKFQDYLYGARFQVWTDNNPLTYVLTSAKLDATGQRWVAALASYEFSIQYRSGSSNVDADALCHGVPGRCSGTAPHEASQDSGAVAFL